VDHDVLARKQRAVQGITRLHRVFGVQNQFGLLRAKQQAAPASALSPTRSPVKFRAAGGKKFSSSASFARRGKRGVL
jgi:hypothetical protein